MVQAIVYVVMLVLAMMQEDDDPDAMAMYDMMGEDGEYSWDDLGESISLLGSELGDSVPGVLKTVGSVTAAKETGLLTSVGIDPSDDDTLLTKSVDLLSNPWFWGGVGLLGFLYLSSRDD